MCLGQSGLVVFSDKNVCVTYVYYFSNYLIHEHLGYTVKKKEQSEWVEFGCPYA